MSGRVGLLGTVKLFGLSLASVVFLDALTAKR